MTLIIVIKFLYRKVKENEKQDEESALARFVEIDCLEWDLSAPIDGLERCHEQIDNTQ